MAVGSARAGPGDADDAVAGDAEAAVALAVLAEGSPGAVGLKPSSSPIEARLGPEAIDLEAVLADGEPGVEPWARDPVAVEEGEEAFLERAADPAAGVVLAGVRGSLATIARASVPWVAVEERRAARPRHRSRGIPSP